MPHSPPVRLRDHECGSVVVVALGDVDLGLQLVNLLPPGLRIHLEQHQSGEIWMTGVT